MALEVRPAHDPTREYGFLGVVVDTTNLEGSIWTWWREDGRSHRRPPPSARAGGRGRPAAAAEGLGAVPPLVTDIDLSLDDRFLYARVLRDGSASMTFRTRASRRSPAPCESAESRNARPTSTAGRSRAGRR